MGITFGPGMVRALEERLAEVTAERDRLAAVVREAHAAAAELHHASWCSEVLWRGGCSCGVQELTDTLAAAATHQGNPSSVGSGCDGDHGAGTPDPAAAGRPTGRPAPKDTHTAHACAGCSQPLTDPPFTLAEGHAWHPDCWTEHEETP